MFCSHIGLRAVHCDRLWSWASLSQRSHPGRCHEFSFIVTQAFMWTTKLRHHIPSKELDRHIKRVGIGGANNGPPCKVFNSQKYEAITSCCYGWSPLKIVWICVYQTRCWLPSNYPGRSLEPWVDMLCTTAHSHEHLAGHQNWLPIKKLVV